MVTIVRVFITPFNTVLTKAFLAVLLVINGPGIKGANPPVTAPEGGCFQVCARQVSLNLIVKPWAFVKLFWL